ncbi:hypothetical protein D3C72_930150 [compost metagenome]
MRRMFDLDIVNLGVVGHHMGTRHLWLTIGFDRQFSWITFCFFSPCIFTGQLLYDLFCNGNGCTAWCIQLLQVVGFFYQYIIGILLVHQLCQVFIYCKENVYPQAKVR